MSNENSLFAQLDDELSRLLSTTSPAYRRRLSAKLAKAIRTDQQKRIRSQKNPDGSAYQARKTKVLRSKQSVEFLYKGEVRRLRSWRSTKGRNGRMITGFDEERGALRSFYRSDIDRFLAINLSETRRSTKRPDPMFQRLRTARFLRMQSTPAAAVVGFQGRAAAIARQHQYGLTGTINELAKTQYPQRELLGLSPHERVGLLEIIYQDLMSAK
ncbi:phage virion morphogenesis protein [Providencia huaxiensis]|uniref:phage virion morphogenesis protein n=1 Tax=Providencia huaxiensis TaxID=2027290 RepID=UPI0032DA3109